MIPGAAGLRSWWRRVRRGDGPAALFFAAPWIIGFCWLQLYPVLGSLYYSFTSYNIFREPQYIGLSNYETLFLHDSVFRTALRNTGVFALVSVPLNLTIALVLALLLNRNIPGRSAFRAIFYFPAIIPTIAMGILWIMLLTPQGGLVNVILGHFGIGPIPWLTRPDWAMRSLILVNVWTVGPAVVIFLAGLQDVPKHLYEAAELDGAGPLRLVRNITIPILSPVILFNLIIGVIAALQAFALPYVLFANQETGGKLGGPLNSALLYSVQLYSVAFEQFRMGYASAMAWVMTVIVFTMSLFLLKFTRGAVHYE